jgi:rhomboid protease GluP
MTYVEIYSSYLIAECDQRAFVLKAVGIEHVVARNDNRFSLLVPEEFVDQALEQLRLYDEESRPKPPAPPLRLHPHAWAGAIAYAVVMLAVSYCAGADAGGFDWYAAGALTHAAVDGEPWRIVTALMLHADVGHLLGNLAFGIPYAYFAAQLLGVGRAWASILLAASVANLLDASLMSEQQSSIGASTAVFAMLGIVGTFAWRRGQSRLQRWAHRAAPLLAAVALLAFTGAGDENTDVVAHLAGFGTGVVTGLLQAKLPSPLLAAPWMQGVLGAAACGIAIGAWVWGLA